MVGIQLTESIECPEAAEALALFSESSLIEAGLLEPVHWRLQ